MKEYKVGVTVPPFHPWCRGCTAPYFEDMKGLSTRAARKKDGTSYEVPDDMTYTKWKKTQDEAAEISEKPLKNDVESGIIKEKRTNLATDKKAGKHESVSFSKVGSNNFSDDAKTDLYQHERLISGNNYETGILYDSKGNVIFKIKGDKERVSFTKEDVKKMSGGILTHNHPNGSVFSPADISTMWKTGLSEIRACNAKGTYIIRGTVEFKNAFSSVEEIEKAYWHAMNEAGMKYRNIAAQNGKSIIYYIKQADEDGIGLFCEKYGLEFKWEDKE